MIIRPAGTRIVLHHPERRDPIAPLPGYSLSGIGVALGPGVAVESPFPFAGAHGLVVTAWNITDGRVDDVDVSRLIMVAVEDRPTGGTRRLLVADDRADPEQLLCLLDAFQGRLGGPLRELASAVTQDLGYSQLPIECRAAGDGLFLSASPRVLVTLGAPDGLASSGPRYDLGTGSAWWTTARTVASEGWVRYPEHLLDGSLAGHTGLQGRFEVHHRAS